MRCKFCGSEKLVRKGWLIRRDGRKRLIFKCKECGKHFTLMEKHELPSKEFAVKLFKNLIENERLDLVDLCNIRDFYMFLTLDLLGESRKEEVKSWIQLFEEFDSTCKESFRTANGFDNKNYASFFFTLAQILSLKHGIKILENELIDRESFEESFEKTKKKLI